MDDNELPVFPFRINWREGITERFEWLTDILADRLGNEQRRQIRLTPRRSFDVTLTMFGNERSFMDLWMNRMLDSETMFPVWHDATPMTVAAAEGATTIPIDTRYLGFVEGGMAWVFGKDAFAGEAVEIVSVADDGIDIGAPGLQQARGRSTKVAPLIRGLIADEGLTGNRATTSAMENQIRFEVTRANPFDGGAEVGDSYLGLPVLTTKPDAKDDTDYIRLWTFDELDNDIGRRFRLSDQDRAMVGQKHTRLLVGRKAKAEFKAFLYRRNGRQKPLWLPTYNEDFRLAMPAAADQAFIEVERCGFTYTGGPTSGREYIMIEARQGRLYRKITATAHGSAWERERIILNAVLGVALVPADIRCISFIDTARLDADQVEIAHTNDADGASRCQLALKTFRNERTAPTPISVGIPIADMVAGACGTNYPEEGDPCNPLFIFDGWYVKIRHEFPITGGMSSGPDHFLENMDTLQSIISTEVCPSMGPFGCYDGLLPYGLEYTWTANDVPVGTNWRHRLQFSFGAVAGGTTGRLMGRRWDSNWTTIIDPTAMGGSFPINYDFVF